MASNGGIISELRTGEALELRTHNLREYIMTGIVFGSLQSLSGT